MTRVSNKEIRIRFCGDTGSSTLGEKHSPLEDQSRGNFSSVFTRFYAIAPRATLETRQKNLSLLKKRSSIASK